MATPPRRKPARRRAPASHVVKVRMAPTMRARLDRFARELSLSRSSIILHAVASYIDRQLALRGEAYVEIPQAMRAGGVTREVARAARRAGD
jgi:metal-responsive CopG/Arc/MetJ family transcriptional regulator